jgi:hypothetical protein
MISGSRIVTGNGIRTGDWMIYRKTKFSTHPGPRAQNVLPAENGDEYAYTVDKFWIVAEVRPDGSLLLKTRRGKEHVVRPNDPSLRKANWWERWRYRSRFDGIAESMLHPAVGVTQAHHPA